MEKNDPKPTETLEASYESSPSSGPLMEDFSPEMRRALMGQIDVHGNAGVGLVAKFGTCVDCGRDNKIVGPKDFSPELRNCFGGCDSQKGLTIYQRKMIAMGFAR